jgi:hypothetical protein
MSAMMDLTHVISQAMTLEWGQESLLYDRQIKAIAHLGDIRTEAPPRMAVIWPTT